MALLTLLAWVGGTLLVFGLYKFLQFFIAQFTSPLRDLPGPKSPSFFYGNMQDIWKAEQAVLQEKWVDMYGTTLKFKGFLNTDCLYTTDTKALSHVLMNADIYQKPEKSRYHMSQILGPGLIVVEGEKHKQERKIMNPAFGPVQIRDLTEIFVQKSVELRDVWSSMIEKSGSEQARVDVVLWLSRMTLDVIGLAGFNYEFNALDANNKPNELNQAFSDMSRFGDESSLMPILQARLPIFRLIKTDRDARLEASNKTMFRIGNELIHASKQDMSSSTEKGGSTTRARDLLSLLVRANMATDLLGSQRLSDEDLLAQVPTFIVAGHETTSTATAWALYALSKDLAIQSKLRDELLDVSTDDPTMDELNALPYLDHVVRETLRVHAPVPSTERVATKDDVLPLNQPLVDKKGRKQEFIRIRKGEAIEIPILAMNRMKSLWGEDALEFRPERWESVPHAVASIPGVWGNMLSFLGGPRACIGYRFSLVEMKALMFTLVRAFEFEFAVPLEDITPKITVVQRPMLRSDPNGRVQLPLLIRPYRGEGL